MFTLLSPAKKLLNNVPNYCGDTTEPVLLNKTLMLTEIMSAKSVQQIATLMKLSPELAALNYERYQKFNLKEPSIAESYPALFLFQGDVYQGLQASDWDLPHIHFSQSHLGILSGLYGLLKPLDRIQPYRLEMGIRLDNPGGNNLYEFWRESITTLLNKQLAAHDNPVLINLASTEYFKVVDRKQMNYPIVTINFYEHKNHEIKMIGTYAKKARGIMAKFIMQHGIDNLKQIKEFNESGYVFNPDSSSEHHLDFIRIH